MAASHSSPPPKKPRAPPPNWLDLPADVSVSILRRLDPVDILSSAQHVCSNWRRICRDPSMWTSISISYRGIPWHTKHELTKLYRLAVDLSSGGLVDITMEYFAAPHDLLRYIADRSNHLRRLRLVHCGDIPDQVLIDVAGKMPFLEEIDLSYCEFSSEVVAAFGRLCPRLQSFKLNARGCKLPSLESDDEAFAIAKNMPGIHHLQIFGNRLTNAGLFAILDGCQQLESLDLGRCFHVSLDADLERRCTQRIKHVHGPKDSPAQFLLDSDDSDSYLLDFMAELDDEEMYYEYL